MNVFVYILRCANGSYYTGLTRRTPEERESEHNLGLDPEAWTYQRRPVTLVWSGQFDRIDEAIATERRIKGWRRAKKEALIRNALDRLPTLASRGRKSTISSFETRTSPAPQDEDCGSGFPPHPEEARSAVSKDEESREMHQ